MTFSRPLVLSRFTDVEDAYYDLLLKDHLQVYELCGIQLFRISPQFGGNNQPANYRGEKWHKSSFPWTMLNFVNSTTCYHRAGYRRLQGTATSCNRRVKSSGDIKRRFKLPSITNDGLLGEPSTPCSVFCGTNAPDALG